MEGLQRSEGFLHAIVKEFLETQGFTETLEAYNAELFSRDIEPDLDLLPSPLDEESAKAKDDFLRMYQLGKHKKFWKMWNKHVTKTCQAENDTQRLEFKLQLYFAVFPLLEDETRLSPVEASMNEFKKYLETNGATLSQTTEFVAFYALPYVPNPKNHPTFKTLFHEEWRGDVQKSLTLFLDNILYAEPLPYLYKLNVGAVSKDDGEKEENERMIAELREEIKRNESRANSYFEKFAKLQGDYHNLIGIAAELVDSLEQCVRGKMISPEYLQDICQRLFGEAMKKEGNVDLMVPGTASSMLRASISIDVNSDSSSSTPSSVSPIGNSGVTKNLNFTVIQKDLAGPASSRQKSLLLQALIWQLTKKTGENREAAVSSYISHDLLGCSNGSLPTYVTKICSSNNDLVIEYLARLVNVLSSFTDGRVYMSQSDALAKKLISMMVNSKISSLVSENLLGALQKLSLRRHAQTLLIDNNTIEWLFKVLEDPDILSDYALEYTVALLMNLCLRTSGKKKCCSNASEILKSLSDLLGFENAEIKPYINGTIYSILSLPSIRKTALSMGYEDVLNCYLVDKSQDERQIRFIIKQLNTVEPVTDEDVQSDDEDEDDDDEEGDAVETEVQKPESIVASMNEKNGDELLRSRYTNATYTSSQTSLKSNQHKKKSHLQSLDEDGPLTRPITPASRLQNMKSSFSNTALQNRSYENPPVNVERPRTSSSKGARRPPPEQASPLNDDGSKKLGLSKKKVPGKSFQQGFTSRPKIPRTPEVNSRPTSGTEIPPLTRSISPPRPDSGRGSKPGSRGSQQQRL